MSELIERLRAHIPEYGPLSDLRLDIDEAAATIAQLQAELAEQKERLGKALKLQMDERHKAEAEAKLWFDKAQKWGAELAEAREVPGRIVDWLNSQPETLHHDDIATAIEARDWSEK